MVIIHDNVHYSCIDCKRKGNKSKRLCLHYDQEFHFSFRPSTVSMKMGIILMKVQKDCRIWCHKCNCLRNECPKHPYRGSKKLFPKLILDVEKSYVFKIDRNQSLLPREDFIFKFPAPGEIYQPPKRREWNTKQVKGNAISQEQGQKFPKSSHRGLSQNRQLLFPQTNGINQQETRQLLSQGNLESLQVMKQQEDLTYQAQSQSLKDTKRYYPFEDFLPPSYEEHQSFVSSRQTAQLHDQLRRELGPPTYDNLPSHSPAQPRLYQRLDTPPNKHHSQTLDAPRQQNNSRSQSIQYPASETVAYQKLQNPLYFPKFEQAEVSTSFLDHQSITPKDDQLIQGLAVPPNVYYQPHDDEYSKKNFQELQQPQQHNSSHEICQQPYWNLDIEEFKSSVPGHEVTTQQANLLSTSGNNFYKDPQTIKPLPFSSVSKSSKCFKKPNSVKHPKSITAPNPQLKLRTNISVGQHEGGKVSAVEETIQNTLNSLKPPSFKVNNSILSDAYPRQNIMNQNQELSLLQTTEPCKTSYMLDTGTVIPKSTDNITETIPSKQNQYCDDNASEPQNVSETQMIDDWIGDMYQQQLDHSSNSNEMNQEYTASPKSYEGGDELFYDFGCENL